MPICLGQPVQALEYNRQVHLYGFDRMQLKHAEDNLARVFSFFCLCLL